MMNNIFIRAGPAGNIKAEEPVKVITGIRRCGKSSPLKLMIRHLRETSSAPNGNPRPVAQKIVHILSAGRRFVLHPAPPGMTAMIALAASRPPAVCFPRSFSSAGTPRPGTIDCAIASQSRPPYRAWRRARHQWRTRTDGPLDFPREQPNHALPVQWLLNRKKT